jgi:biotin carboxyl carrier protein
LKLRITIEGRIYEAEVEILEDEDSEHPYVPYTPAPASNPGYPIPGPLPPAGVIEIKEDGGKICRSPVTGLVIQVNVVPGQAVQSNDVLMVLEAMKMENQVTATHPGTVKSINVAPGSSVKVQQVLLEFE